MQHRELLHRTSELAPFFRCLVLTGRTQPSVRFQKHSLEQRGDTALLIGNGFSTRTLNGLKPRDSLDAADASRDFLKQRWTRGVVFEGAHHPLLPQKLLLPYPSCHYSLRRHFVHKINNCDLSLVREASAMRSRQPHTKLRERHFQHTHHQKHWDSTN